MKSHPSFPATRKATAAWQRHPRQAESRGTHEIGQDPDLRHAIEQSMDRLVAALETRLGAAAEVTSQAAFKRDFGIARSDSWTVMWDWPAERAHEVINYLEGRYAEASGKLPARPRGHR